MPRGFHIASAWVDINAESKGLREQVKKAVEDAVRGQDAKIKLTIDSKGLRREVTDALKEATKGTKPAIPIGIKATGLRGEVSRALKEATDAQKPKVKLGISSAGLRAEVQRALTAATKDQKPTVKLAVSSTGLRGEVQRALAAATAGQNGIVHVRVDMDDTQIARTLADSHPTIRPDIDMAGARGRMMAAIRGLNLNADVNINPDLDAALFRAKIQAEVGRIRQRLTVPITPDLNVSQFEAKIRAAAATVRGRATDIPIDLNPRINTLMLRAQVGAAAASIRGQIQFNGTLNTAMTRARLLASLAAAQAGTHITIPVRYDTKQLRALFGDIESAFRAIEGPTGRWAKIIQAGALAALPVFAALDHAIRSTGASLAVIVPLTTMLVSTFAAAKIGMEGIGTVISGIFNEEVLTNHQLDVMDVTLKGLAPSALRFANAMKNVKGQFTDLRKSVQEVLFSNFDNTLNQFAKQTLPVLKLGLAGTADQLNRMTIGMINVANTSARTGELKVAFGAIQTAMEPLVPLPGRILNALTKMTISAAPLLTRMTQSFGDWSEKMTGKLNKAFDNGTLQASISKAGDTIVNFFHRIANNPEFTTFLERMKSNGPQISQTFGDIATALMKIVNALAPISAVVMKIVDGFAKFINAIPTVFLDAFIIKLVLFKSALAITGIVKALVTALGGLKLAVIALSSTQEMMMLFALRLEALGVAYGSIMRLSAAFAVLTRAGLLLGGLALTFVTLSWAVDKVFGDGRVHANIDKMADGLNHLRLTGQASGEMARVYGKDFNKLGDAIEEIAHPGTFDRISHGFKRMGEAIGINGDSWQKTRDTMKAADKQLADLVKNGDMASATALYRQMSLAALKNGTSIAKLNTLIPGYQKALKNSREAQEIAAKTMGVFGARAQEVSGRLQQLKTDTDGLVQSLFALNNTQRDANQATRDMEQSAEAMVKATKKKAIGLDFENGQLVQNTKLQQDAAAAIEDYAGKTEKSALATYQANGNWEQASKTLTTGRAAILKAAEAAGMGTTAAEAYADSIFKIPSKKEFTLMLVDQATRQLQDVTAAFRAAPEKKVITVSTLSTVAIEALTSLGYKVEQLPDGSFTVTAKTAPAEADLKKIEGYKINPKTVQVLADIANLNTNIDKAQGKVDSLRQKRKTAVGADKSKLDAAITAAQKKVDALRQKKATIILLQDLVSRKVAKAQDVIDAMHGKTVTVTVTINGKKTGVDPDKYYSQGPHRFGGLIKRAYGGVVQAFDGGGSVMGPGGPMSDVIHAMLSNGEFVMRAAAVKKYGTNFMSLLNQGMFPKFAQGGPVTSNMTRRTPNTGGATGAGLVQSVKVLANTDDIDSKVLKTQQLLKTIVMPKPVTFTALDQTKVATTQAKTNFQSVATVNRTAYSQIGTQTNAFKTSLSNQMLGLKNNNTATWQQWRTGMEGRTTATYTGMKSATNSFATNTVGKLTSTKAASHTQWNQFKSGMESRTNQTYSNIKGATNSFGTQTQARMKSIVSGTGSAWGGLSPKFKPPVSYLVHTVINQGLVGSMNAIMSKLGGGKKVGGISVAGFARGGPIYGEGTATSDSISARLSHGEYVIQAKAVKKFGLGFFNQVNAGGMPGQGAGYKPGFANGGLVNIKMSPGFATGGAVPSSDTLNKILGDGGNAGAKRMTDYIMTNHVLPLIDSGSGGSAMKDVQRAGAAHIQSNVEAFVKENFGGAGSASAGLRWAKTQYGKGYQWGGNGNPSWDCSGFMSAIESVIRGEKPHRRWATGSFGSSGPSGWKRNAKAPFQIGVTNAGVGHTAGTVGKENVESSGGVGVHGGVGVPRGAADAMFTSRWGYVGPNATKKAFGGLINGPGTGTSDSVPTRLSNGEFVIQAKAAKRLGLDTLNALNSGYLATGGTTYTVKKGDTLSGIASKYKITLATLLKANPSYKSHPNLIKVGNKLAIPGTAPKKTTTPAKAAPKAPAGDIESADGAANLKALVTLGEVSTIANKTGSGIRNETLAGLSSQDSLSTLLSNLNTTKTGITQAFKGKSQDAMLAKFTATANKLIPLQQNLDKVNKSLESAQTALDDVKGKFDGLKSSVSDSIVQFGAITKIGKYGTSPGTIIQQLQSDVTKSQNFASMLDQLKTKGVSGDLIGQIASAGITGGGMWTADSLLKASPEEIAKINQLQGQLTTAADKAGTAAATAMYGAGVQAAQGLVDGLKAQQKAIEAQMAAIAATMVTAIKQALGIKSPSRVMAQIGNYTALGFAQGMTDKEKDVKTAVLSLGNIPASLTPASIPTSNTANGNGTMAGQQVTIQNLNVTVNGTFDFDSPKSRQQLAQNIASEIKEAIRRDDRKRI